jgi:5-methyltetrahydropteroyltriglutamate--homocysteine methyltransferase
MIRIHEPMRWLSGDANRSAVPVAATHASRAAVWRAQQAKGRDFVTVGAKPGIDAVTQTLVLVGADDAAFNSATTFQLDASALLSEIDEAIALPASPCVALLGPVSLLFLGASVDEGFDRLSLLDRLLAVYEALLTKLAARGVTWVQIDEPLLGEALPPTWQDALRCAYARLLGVDQHLMLTTGAALLPGNLALACELPVAGLHINAPIDSDELKEAAQRLPRERELSVSVGSADAGTGARNLTALRALRQLRGGRVWLAGEVEWGVRDNAPCADELVALQRALWRDDAAMARGPAHVR